MTLKRYQPVRKRKRPSKKNRPFKLLAALGVIGLAVGGVYLAMHGEVLVGLVNGAVDLPDTHFQRPAEEQAVVAAKIATERQAAPTATPSVARLKTATLVAPKPSAAPSATLVAAAPADTAPKPSAFPEAENPAASAAPLKPAVAQAKPAAPVQAPLKVTAKPATPAKSPSPAPKAVKAVAQAQPAAAPSARPSIAPIKAAAPKAPAKAAVKAPVRPNATAASLYFDKNSSYLSAAEQRRVAQLAASLAQRGGTIHITGFADGQGDAKYNRWMAERRAERVAALIKHHGGGQVNVVVDAVGSVGAASGTDGEARNRRVEVQLR